MTTDTTPTVFSDRNARIAVLAERAAQGVALFIDGETVQLPIQPRRHASGRHHRKHRRTPRAGRCR